MELSRQVVIVAVAALLPLSACGAGNNAAPTAGTIATIEGTNYVTIPPVTTPPPTAAPTVPAQCEGRITTEQTYVVKAGDGVSGIAQRYGVTVQDLVTINGWASSSQRIDPGQSIKLPPCAYDVNGTGTGSNNSNSGNTSNTTPGEGCIHTIVKGENPSKVAKKYGITVADLQGANDPAVYNSFLVGAKLTIPAGGKC